MTSDLVLRRLSDADFHLVYKIEKSPVEIAYVAEAGGKIVAAGGIVNKEGEVWGFFDVFGEIPCLLKLIRLSRTMLDALRSEYGRIPFLQDNACLESSGKLMRLMGLKNTGYSVDGMKVFE